MQYFFLIFCLLALGVHENAAAQTPAGSAERPNVILVMADDLGWGDTSYYGHPVLQTPGLDQMAKDGMRFDRFYSAAPVCSPTRGSAVTGRHPFRYGIKFANTGHMKPQELTLAEVLRKQGYRTGHFGKWHMGTLTKDIKDSNRGGRGDDHYAPPWEHGFDTCFSTEAKTPTWWNDGDYESYGTRYWTGAGEPVSSDGILGDDSRIIMDNALPFIENAVASQKKFFSVIWFHTPHKPVVAGPEMVKKYLARIPEDYPGDREHAAHYYGCIDAMDAQMVRLRKRLEALGVASNTMIWFCSDNGPENKTAGRAVADLDGPGGRDPVQLRARKRSLYEGGVRVPGLLVWPDQVKPGQITTVPCVTSDFLPTLLQVASTGEAIRSRPIDGVSLVPLIQNGVLEREQPIGFQSRNQASMIDNRFKIIRQGDAAWQLYDLVEDPGERHPIDDPQRIERMVKRFQRWKESCDRSSQGADYTRD